MRTFLPDQLGGLTSMNLHDLITLIILFIGTSRTNEIQYIKYTSEYIPKLQINQKSFVPVAIGVINGLQFSILNLFNTSFTYLD